MQCTAHPDDPASASCSRCETALCEACTRKLGPLALCQSCLDHLRDLEAASSSGTLDVPAAVATPAPAAHPGPPPPPPAAAAQSTAGAPAAAQTPPAADLYEPEPEPADDVPPADDIPSDNAIEAWVRDGQGSTFMTFVLAFGVGLVGCWAWYFLTYLAGSATWALVPLGWAIGTAAALGARRTGPVPARVGAAVAAFVILFGGFVLERWTKPELTDFLAGMSRNDMAMYMSMGELPAEQVRAIYALEHAEWQGLNRQQRRMYQMPLLDEIDGRFQGTRSTRRMTFVDYLSIRILRPVMFVLVGLALALAWRAGAGGDATSLIWGVEKRLGLAR